MPASRANEVPYPVITAATNRVHIVLVNIFVPMVLSLPLMPVTSLPVATASPGVGTVSPPAFAES